jgi:uridine kinase
MPDFLFKHFDKIIFLIREDTISQSESYLYRTNSNAYNWHTPEKYDLSIISENSLNEKNKNYTDSNQFLISYCNQIGFPIYTYEDIFIKKNINPINQIFNYLGIELDYSLYNEWVLNPLKKERL